MTPARTCDEVQLRLGNRRFQSTIIKRIDNPRGPLADVPDERRGRVSASRDERDTSG